jgi:hypothetical protein
LERCEARLLLAVMLPSFDRCEEMEDQIWRPTGEPSVVSTWGWGWGSARSPSSGFT